LSKPCSDPRKAPETIAREIRDKFGDDFAARLKEHL
jgi:hypothetical protein